ncbi:hypothetical protein [uncultured Anaerococcus sp.]|uniref:hypothetical protein n=1 Tax=uncultured Anaerococcus sp. TaxID=293428 RepID=UPI00288AD767|nr:hypothetical protein [uncultured Anaerococcus sp.]
MTKYNKEDLKKILSEEAYHVTQENGTEMPFSSEKKLVEFKNSDISTISENIMKEYKDLFKELAK